MELQRKRTYQMMDDGHADDGYQNKQPSYSGYMNKVGEELENILSFPEVPSQVAHEDVIRYAEGPSQVAHEDVIRNSLVKLGHDVTDIKYTLEKKKPKVSLVQLNEKLDIIIELLRRPHGD